MEIEIRRRIVHKTPQINLIAEHIETNQTKNRGVIMRSRRVRRSCCT